MLRSCSTTAVRAKSSSLTLTGFRRCSRKPASFGPGNVRRHAGEQRCFYLLIAGLGLPDANGLDLCRELKRQKPDTATCQKVGFTPKVLQDTDIERTLIHAVAAGLGVALLPEEVKKFPHENVSFRPMNPAVATESCIAWKKDNTSAALKSYIQIVADAGTSMR